MLVLTALVALVLVAGADGYRAGRAVDVRAGDNADFRPSGWRCHNYGASVQCFSGDALPYAELTSTRAGDITVSAHTLRDPQGGHVTRTYVRGLAVWVFTAF